MVRKHTKKHRKSSRHKRSLHRRKRRVKTRKSHHKKRHRRRKRNTRAVANAAVFREEEDADNVYLVPICLDHNHRLFKVRLQ